MLFLQTIIDSIFPRSCVLCNKQKTSLCLECMSALQKNTSSPHPHHSHAILSYRDKKVKKILTHFKFKNRTELAQPLATLLYDSLLEVLEEARLIQNIQTPIFVPIPLSNKRQRTRGYNQSELLCKELKKLDNSFIVNTSILKKTKDTKSQSSITNKKERQQNIKGCFTIHNTKQIEGKHIILIDDITTTGATINEATKALKKAGARTISSFTIAH